MILHRGSRSLLTLAFLALPATASAQAFGLNEIGSCAIARGFAVTSSPCNDASSIYWNPGVLPTRQGFQGSFGAALISLDGDFTRDTTHRRYESTIPTSVVPAIFGNYRKGAWAYGLGVYVPYGLTSQWGDEFPGRFSAKKASLQTVYVQPNIAYQINDDWSVGGGPIWGHSSVELIQALDLSTQVAQPNVTFANLGIAKYTEFARANLNGSTNAWGAQIGVHGKLGKDWQMGARFMSSLDFKYDDADVSFQQINTGLILAAGNPLGLPGGTPVDAVVAPQFTGTGALVTQKVTTQIKHPAQAVVGFTYSGLKSTLLSAEYAWTGWKSFDVLPITFLGPAATKSRVLVEDYNNTSALRLGADYSLKNGVALRAGFVAAASAAPPETVTPLLPEMDRQLGMIGLGLPIATRFGVDVSYAHIFTPGSRGRLDERTPGMTSAQALALNNGAYTLNANIWSFTFRYNH